MNEHDEYDVAEPSRRRLLKGVGALGGAFALAAGGCPAGGACGKTAKRPRHALPGRAYGNAAVLW